jgi:hypothetical protein
MARQTFTASQVLTAAQMTALQSNDFNQTVSTKTASYTLVAADAGTKVVMNAGATNTAITVNTSLFSAGDTLTILNISTSGTCTITAGTATVSTAGSLALGLNQGGTLYFTSAGVSVFQADGITSRILQVVQGTLSTQASSTSSTFADTGLTVSITPSLSSSKVLVFATSVVQKSSGATNNGVFTRIVRGSTTISSSVNLFNTGTALNNMGSYVQMFLDSPSTTSATTYKITFANQLSDPTVFFASGNSDSSIVCMEVSA